MRAALRRFSLLSVLLCSVTVTATLCGVPGAARADVFYAVSNYENGSAGTVRKDGGSFSVDGGRPGYNFGMDAAGLTFRDAGGAERAMIREYRYGPNDTVYVWDPADFGARPVNLGTWGSNVHAVASGGRYLYAATYESYKDGSDSQDTGEVVRIDMEDGYKPDRRYRYEAFTGDAGFKSSPHGEAIHIADGKIYVLFGVSYRTADEYEPTEVVEFDLGLNRLRTVRLKDSAGNVGKNAMRMAAHGGKLYVANMGGYQGPDSWGDLWEVDTGSMTSRRVLDGHDIPYTVDGEPVNVGMYGIQFAQDGTAFLLAGSYGGDYAFRARLFITTAERLARGDAGSAAADFSGSHVRRGYSWDILWDEKDSALWLMAGTALEARDKSGALIREFTPAELGDNVYSIALLDDAPAGGNEGGGDGSGGGGGCSGGASAAASVLGVAYMTLKRKKALFTVLLTAVLALPALGAAEGAQVKLLVTPGAGVRAFTKGDAHFVPFTEHSLTKGPDEGRYEVYSGSVPGESFHYVAGGGGTGFLKTAEVVYVRADEAQKTVTVDVETLNPSRREDGGFMAADVYLNVNDAQHLVLNAGETFRLIPTRVWQAMQGVTGNYFIEPDYDVEVIGGTDAVSNRQAGSPGLEYTEVTGLKPGVAVIKVTYGPIFFQYGNGGEYYNPIDPLNTGTVVVTVLEAGKSKNSGITTDIQAREYDTVYFDRAEADHAEYTFRPSAGGETSVRAHRPLHGGTAWGAGWGGAVKNADGSFTVGLYEGRNVVEVSAAGAAFSEHHVINARGIDINVKNLTDPGWKKGDALSPGDSLEISFGGIKTPLEKIAGIYNPGFPDTCYVKYESPDGVVRGDGVQYDLSDDNALAVTVPASGTVRLRKGVINCDHMGDPLGSHRTRIGSEPVYRNFAAVNVKGEYSSMPDITLGSAVTSAAVTGDGGARPATEGDVRALLPAGAISAAPDGTVTVSVAAFREGLGGADRAAVDAGTVTPLPVSVSGVTAGGTALVTLRIRPGGFTGEAFGAVAVLKMKPGGAVARLGMAASRDALADGLFVWADAAERVISPSEKMAAGAEYSLCVAVEDGGGYDLDGERQGTVVDPLALALADTGAGDGGSGDGGNGGAAGTGGGGGCDTGALSIAGAAVLLAVSLKTRKNEGGV